MRPADDDEAPQAAPLPTRLIPRWLAALVLALLLAAGALSAWLLVSADLRGPQHGATVSPGALER